MSLQWKGKNRNWGNQQSMHLFAKRKRGGCKVMESEKNRAILTQFIDEVWNKGNFEHLGDFIDLQYTIHHDPGDRWESQTLDLATFKKRVIISRTIFPDLFFTLQEFITEEDKIVISWVFQGSQKGDLPKLPATGKHVNVSGMTIYYFNDGKITGHWQVFDRLGLLEQLGVFE
jgi:steroid delta-isomerase-like uncharacterized protein